MIAASVIGGQGFITFLALCQGGRSVDYLDEEAPHRNHSANGGLTGMSVGDVISYPNSKNPFREPRLVDLQESTRRFRRENLLHMRDLLSVLEYTVSYEHCMRSVSLYKPSKRWVTWRL